MTTPPNPIYSSKETIQDILQQVCQNEVEITKLKTALENTTHDVEVQLNSLIYIYTFSPSADAAMNCLLRWRTHRELFYLIVELCRKDKMRMGGAKSTRNKMISIDSPDQPTESIRNVYHLIVANILTNFKEVLEFKDQEKQNILHLAVREGTEYIVQQILSLIPHIHSQDKLEDLLREKSQKVETPMKVAIYNNDDSLVRILAKYDDGVDLSYRVLNVAEDGKLELLEVLLEDRKDWDRLLNINVLTGVARTGHENVWEYITKKKPGLANNAVLLKVAIENHHLGIVKYLLKYHPGLLISLEAGESVAEIAVDCAKKEVGKPKPRKISNEKGGTINPAERIRNLILDKMMRTLSPYQIKIFWPKTNGKYNLPIKSN